MTCWTVAHIMLFRPICTIQRGYQSIGSCNRNIRAAFDSARRFAQVGQSFALICVPAIPAVPLFDQLRLHNVSCAVGI